MIHILRLSHRIERDKRITSHLILTARAFGADKVFYSGQKDKSLENSINKITKKFGGPFSIEYIKDPISFVRNKKNKYKIVHLTMYGLPYKKFKKDNLLIIVGSEKVLKEFYELADFNVSITSQPISEVSALAIFLEKLDIKKNFENAEVKVVPQKTGKKLINLKK